jgi:hypothetical protein
MLTSQAEERKLKLQNLEKNYAGFSCPQEGFNQGFARQLAVKFARKCLRSFVDRFEPELNGAGANLKPYLEAWLEADCPLEEAWSPFFGIIHEAFTLPPEASSKEVLWRTGSLALYLTERGYEGNWTLNLTSPVKFRFANLLLPQCVRLEAHVADGQVKLELLEPSGNKVAIKPFKKDLYWHCNDSRIQIMPGLILGGRPVYLIPAAGAALPELAVIDERSSTITKDMDHTVEQFQKALELISNNCPEYLEWIGRVVRVIAPVGLLEDSRCSGSHPYRPGQIYISVDDTPTFLAEAMIHEATHQYMFLLTRLGSLENGTDSKLYYSPVRRIERPIEAIALAYHAFGNVLLFYKSCKVVSPVDKAYLTAMEGEVEKQFSELEVALRSSTGLSAIGRAIWEPLPAHLI